MSSVPSAPIHLSGMHHTGIVVHDLAAMERFYVDQLGLTKLKEIDSIAPPGGNHTGVPDARRKLVFLELTSGGHQIELVHYLSPPASAGGLDKHQLGAMHVCFTVDDIEAVYAQLSAQGVQFATEPKYSEVEGRRIGVVYAQDPEGNWLEFIGGKL